MPLIIRYNNSRIIITVATADRSARCAHMGCISRSSRAAGSIRIVPLGKKRFPCVAERLDLEPERNGNLVPDIERRSIATIDIVVAVELQGSAILAGSPLRITYEITIIAVTA